MNEISIEKVNLTSPYKVWGTTRKNEYNFITEEGVLYGVAFTEEMEIGGTQAYQFSFARLNATRSGFDDGIRKTLMCIINEFFNSNNELLIYICDTSDGRESFRSKLFIKWFDEAEEKQRYIIRTANTEVEGQGFYTALLVEKTNKNLQSILMDFDTIAQMLCDK